MPVIYALPPHPCEYCSRESVPGGVRITPSWKMSYYVCRKCLEALEDAAQQAAIFGDGWLQRGSDGVLMALDSTTVVIAKRGDNE